MTESKKVVFEEKKKGVYKNLLTGVIHFLIRDVLLLLRGQ
jgi:hypothetical protein